MSTTSFIFDNPPINEVVIAVYFDSPLTEFQSQHVGLFWEKLKEEFPVVRQQMPLPININISSEEPLPMPRYWFIATDDITLMQIQKNAFIVNWRRRGEARYPGFQEVKSTFDDLYQQFTEFLRTEFDMNENTINLCELTYIDVIEECDYWHGPEDTNQVIPAFSIPFVNSDNISTDFNCIYSHQLHDSTTLRTRIGTIEQPGRAKPPALVLEMRALKRFEDVPKTEAQKWFNSAHDIITDYFMNITNKEVQRQYWGLREDSA